MICGASYGFLSFSVTGVFSIAYLLGMAIRYQLPSHYSIKSDSISVKIVADVEIHCRSGAFLLYWMTFNHERFNDMTIPLQETGLSQSVSG
jgi:hypothetical protein